MATTEDKKQAEFAERYAQLMNEIRARLDAIPIMRQELSAHIPPYIIIESGYLQLRLVCELIAVGCLIAHGDITATRVGKLRTAKYPTMIIPELERLHPDFYPVPFDVNGDRHTDVTSGFLTKTSLLELYAECGDAVHRGSLKTLIHGGNPKTEHLTKWTTLTKRLLVQHKILLANPKVNFRFFIGPKETAWGVFHDITREEFEVVKACRAPSESLALNNFAGLDKEMGNKFPIRASLDKNYIADARGFGCPENRRLTNLRRGAGSLRPVTRRAFYILFGVCHIYNRQTFWYDWDCRKRVPVCGIARILHATVLYQDVKGDVIGFRRAGHHRLASALRACPNTRAAEACAFVYGWTYAGRPAGSPSTARGFGASWRRQ